MKKAVLVLYMVLIFLGCQREARFYTITNTLKIWDKAISENDPIMALECISKKSRKKLMDKHGKPLPTFNFFVERLNKHWYDRIEIQKINYINNTKGIAILRCIKAVKITFLEYPMIRETNITGEKNWKILWSEL